MTDGDSMSVNNLRDSANGTFVTLITSPSTVFLLLSTRRKIHTDNGKKTVVLYQQFRFSRRGHSAESDPIHRNDFPKGTPVSETSVEKTVVVLLELFSESLIDDDAVFAKKTPLAKAEAEGNLFSHPGRSSYEIAKMHNQQHCARGYSHHRYNNREGSPQTNH